MAAPKSRTASAALAAPDAVPVGLAGRRRRRPRWLRQFLANPAAITGGVLCALVVLAAVFAPILAPQDPTNVDPLKRLLPPFWQAKGSLDSLLGTDPVGRDELSRIIFGARVSLLVGTVAVGLSCLAGTLLGLLAGYYGGWIDDVIMRVADVQLAFPFILLAITLMSVLGANLRNLLIVLAIGGWVAYARLVRGQVLSVKALPFVEAARVLGCGDGRIILRHVLPNVASAVIIVATLQVGFYIIAESGLSFLGLGVDPSVPTWGSMLNEGRTYLLTAWWVVTFPGAAITLTVMGINLLGDWLRDTLDPRLRPT